MKDGWASAAEAISYSGLRLLPLVPGTKRPMIAHWPSHASADPAMHVSWATRWPTANLGVLTGHGLLVVDVDMKNGVNGLESIEDWQEASGIILPATLTVRTPSGGLHWYYRVDGSCPTRAAWLPGVDVRGDGGYVAAPPSRLMGQREAYRIGHGSFDAIEHAPDALIADIRGRRGGSTAGSTGKTLDTSEPLPSTELAMVEGLPVGNRNNTMHRLACRWWGIYGLAASDTVYSIAQQVWAATLDHASFPEGEAAAAVESARRYVQREDERTMETLRVLWRAVQE